MYLGVTCSVHHHPLNRGNRFPPFSFSLYWILLSLSHVLTAADWQIISPPCFFFCYIFTFTFSVFYVFFLHLPIPRALGRGGSFFLWQNAQRTEILKRNYGNEKRRTKKGTLVQHTRTERYCGERRSRFDLDEHNSSSLSLSLSLSLRAPREVNTKLTTQERKQQ